MSETHPISELRFKDGSTWAEHATRHEPPFDGKACPMCPMEARNLSAVVHNLAWRLLDYHGGCASVIVDKFHSLKGAVETYRPPDDAPTELRELWSVAESASKAATLEDLLMHGAALKAASDAVQPLVDRHFADRMHSHGQATQLV